ncbi:MAG: hypothetical protein R2737_01690 [Candidatus Nanopelagicales bacterium]
MTASVPSLLAAIDLEAHECRALVADRYASDPIAAFAALTRLDRAQAEATLAEAGLHADDLAFVDDEGRRRSFLAVARDWAGRTGRSLDSDLLLSFAGEYAAITGEGASRLLADLAHETGHDWSTNRVL